MNHLASQKAKEHPAVARLIMKYIYVNDGLINLKSVQEAIELVKEALMHFAKGTLRLHKLISNNREVSQKVP